MSFLHGSRSAVRLGWCVAAAALVAGCGLSVDGVTLRAHVSHDGATAGDTVVATDDPGSHPDTNTTDGPAADAPADVATAPDEMGGEVASVDAVEAGDERGDEGPDEADGGGGGMSDGALGDDALDAGMACMNNIECPHGSSCVGGFCAVDDAGTVEAAVDAPPPMDAPDAVTMDAADVFEAGPDAPDAVVDAGCTAPCAVTNGVRACVMGVCGALMCAPNYGNCDNNADNGCEYPTASDPNNCGACGRACPSGYSCAFGTCTPPPCTDPGMRTCNTTMGQACVDVRSDPNHCGSCNSVCPSPRACVGGMCACPAGTAPCSNGGSGVTCEDLSSSATSCGMCGSACAAPRSCVAGACRCPADKLFCMGACIPNDNTHCGSCSTVCTNGFSCGASTGPTTIYGCRCASGVTCNGMCVENSVGLTSCGTLLCPPGSVCGSEGGQPACRASTGGAVVNACMRVATVPAGG